MQIVHSWQAVEKAFRREVAAGLPRHISNDFSDRWRHKAAATTFFNSLLDAVSPQLRGFLNIYRSPMSLLEFTKLVPVDAKRKTMELRPITRFCERDFYVPPDAAGLGQSNVHAFCQFVVRQLASS